MRNHYFFLLFFLLFILLFISCVPQRKIVYVQSPKGQLEYNNYWSGNKKNVRIDAFDMLYIKVGTIDQPEYNFFNEENKNNTAMTDASLAVTAYTVDESGFLDLPVVGKVKVKDLTLDEASLAVKAALKDILSTPIVSVRFVNNSITVLGEVLRPGTFTYYTEQINIFRALGLAGDITEYGNKKQVILIRERGKEIHKYYLDITKDDIFRSDYYYLRPNDVIYISPLKIRRLGMKDIPYALIISLINAVVVTFVYIKLLK